MPSATVSRHDSRCIPPYSTATKAHPILRISRAVFMSETEGESKFLLPNRQLVRERQDHEFASGQVPAQQRGSEAGQDSWNLGSLSRSQKIAIRMLIRVLPSFIR
jgi:hypothetical protein